MKTEDSTRADDEALGRSRRNQIGLAVGWHPVRDRVSLEGTKRVHALPGSTDRYTDIAQRYHRREAPQATAAIVKRVTRLSSFVFPVQTQHSGGPDSGPAIERLATWMRVTAQLGVSPRRPMAT